MTEAPGNEPEHKDEKWITTDSRILSDEELKMLQKQDQKLVTEFKRNKLELEAGRYWDLFYKRNSTNFFKDRHWTSREFEEIKRMLSENRQVKLLEAGCGVGNAFFPMLEECSNLYVYACDFSPRAVQFVRDNPMYSSERCTAFLCDLSCQNLDATIPPNSLDVVTLIFALSAIHPDKFAFVLESIQNVLKPSGYLLFRDYGIYDWAMLRFSPGSKISENFYVRQDGTRAYYFAKETMEMLVKKTGFRVVSNEYVMRETINHKKNIKVPRVFLQGKYQKESR
uniref:tRNA N(3)-methylcytidine methyltransferase n=1 Tax=Phallusia mammillata TaxID=59560 RepID=A0A6F9DLI3_9ASCI|nr:methyltransferase-like protein 6 [Phallusia mammillata]